MKFQRTKMPHGHQAFRAELPIRSPGHKWNAVADGQPGGIMKSHREWRTCEDTECPRDGILTAPPGTQRRGPRLHWKDRVCATARQRFASPAPAGKPPRPPQ
jgi:hypothetical protein